MNLTRLPDGTWFLETVLDLPRPVEEVFPFFADAFNLQRITPPFLDFSVTTPGPIDMHPGVQIDYRLRLRGIPMKWRSEITVWEPNRRFIDTQIRGPYRLWHHEHLFEPTDNGTRVIDRVTYAVPGGWLIQKLVVGRDVERIFDYRHTQLLELFG